MDEIIKTIAIEQLITGVSLYLSKVNPSLLNLRVDPAETSSWDELMDPIEDEYIKRVEKVIYSLVLNDTILNELIKNSIVKNDSYLKDFGIRMDLSNHENLIVGDVIRMKNHGDRRFVVIENTKKSVGPSFRGESARIVDHYTVVEIGKINSYKKEDTHLLHEITKNATVYLCGKLKQKITWDNK